MNKIRVWLDKTMAQRTAIKWIAIYAAIILGSIGVIIRACMIPLTMVFCKYGQFVYDKRMFVPLFVAGMIYSAYQMADEIRFLQGKES